MSAAELGRAFDAGWSIESLHEVRTEPTLALPDQSTRAVRCWLARIRCLPV